jgi:putative intracellular protease/amidase
MGFIATPTLRSLVENTRDAASIDVDHFDAIVVAGGQVPMFTFEEARSLQPTFLEFFLRGKVACALCHGVSLLVGNSDDRPMSCGASSSGLRPVFDVA